MDEGKYKKLLEIFTKAKTGPPSLRTLVIRKILCDMDTNISSLASDLMDACKEYIEQNFHQHEAQVLLAKLEKRLQPALPSAASVADHNEPK